ncbi:MAG: hypothetical protein PWP27_174 [Clostridiales bacterium]|jgi:phosphoribosyl 1,2-cyclic phosphodiesterase|nr:hypothetical protein [Clostridiales bacterium]
MNLKVIASSSRGNSYVLESSGKKLLLDLGVNIKKIKNALDYDLSNVVGALVTHEHKDHSKAVFDVARLGIDVYISLGTKQYIEANVETIRSHRIKVVKEKQQFTVGPFLILPFDVQHDAQEPLGYLIQDTNTKEKLLFATDTFYIRYKFPGLHYIMVECNYCYDILMDNIENGKVTAAQKNRLLESHFSLDHVLEFLNANDLSEVRKIILIHLSDSNSNANEMKKEVFKLTGIETVIAETESEIKLELYSF